MCMYIMFVTVSICPWAWRRRGPESPWEVGIFNKFTLYKKQFAKYRKREFTPDLNKSTFFQVINLHCLVSVSHYNYIWLQCPTKIVFSSIISVSFPIYFK